MILGISLVVNELNKGQRMVFRYPESIPQSIDKSTNKGLIKLYDQYFGFSLENLAKLFRPKNALYNKILEISIDDLNFVSYPCQCQGSSFDETSLNDDNSVSNGTVAGPASNSLSPVVVGNSQPVEVITMFNLIVTSVSHKAMLKINPAFAYKCQYKFASMPGSDPVATAIGVNVQSYGLCKETIRRIVEVVAKSLMQEERSNRYVTEQVALMLRIMDNWYLSKQLDASAGGAVHMESGNSAAMAATAAASCENPSTPVMMSRTNSARPGGPTTTSAGVASVASTPRSSRSSSNAPPPDSLASSANVPAGASSNSTTLLSAAISNAGGTGNTTPRASRSNSNAPTMLGDATVPASGLASVRSSTANSSAVSASGTPDLNEVEFQRSAAHPHVAFGIAKTLSIDTEFETNSLETSPVPSFITTVATTPGPPLAPITPGATGVASMSALSTGSGSTSNATSPVKPGNAGNANGALAQFHRTERGERSNLNSPATLPPNHPDHAHTAGGLPHPQSSHSRTNSGMPQASGRSAATPVKPAPTPSAASGLSGPGSASFGSMGLSSIASGSSMGDALGSPSSKDRRSTEWGAHLLTDFMAQSDLANELRILFHSIVGGHSVNISFNSVKSIQVSLFCKDRMLCDCSHTLKTQRPIKGVNSQPATPRRPLSTSTVGTAGTLNTPNHSTPGGSVSISMSAGGSGSGSSRMRAGVSPRAVGNLNSALSSQKNGKNSKDYAKIKGINLNTQTMLKIADTDTIMNILYSLDSTAFGLVGSSSESSNLNIFQDLGGSDGNCSTQNAQNVQHHLRMLTSNRLYTVIEAADPTSSFLDLSLALDEPVEEVISMANYLKSWGLVEIIPVIYGRSCYKVHSKSPLSRDSRVGRAFEALLLSFELPLSETSPRTQDFDRSTSEQFMPVQDGTFESFHSSEGHSSPKRRSSSMTSNDLEVLVRDKHGHHQNPHARDSHGHHSSATLNHSQSTAHLHSAHLHPTTSFGVPGQSTLPGGPSHHLVSPAISKYRQRRESCQDLGALKNSRSSEHFLRNMITSSNSLHGINVSERGVLTLPPAVAAVKGPSSPPVQSTAHAVPTANTAFSGPSGTRGASPSAAAAFARGDTSAAAPPARARGSSFGADSIKPRPSAGGFSAAIASFLHQVANHANDTMSNQRKSAEALFRDVDSQKDLSQSAVVNRKNREDARAGENGSNMVSSSFPPSSMGALNSSAANKELGFQHIVSLSEVGGLSSSPLPGMESVEDLFSTSGSAKSPFGLLDDGAFDEVKVVHNLDVAENIPLQYSLPALLSAFNSARVLSEVIDMWPEAVRDFSVEIIVFLLRWHVIVPVDAYIVNMLHMFEQSAQAEAAQVIENERRSPVPGSAAGAGAKTPPVPPVSTARVNFALDTTPSASHGTSPSAYSGSFYRGSSESKASQHEEVHAALRAQLPSDLTSQELTVIERLFPFIAHHAVSSKTISDIVWVVRIPEEDIIHVVEKIPFLQIVKKIAP